MRLRSVELEMPKAGAAVDFLLGTWGLFDAGKSRKTSYLRGTGDHPYVLAVSEGAKPAIASVSFSGSEEELERIRSRAAKAGVALHPYAAEADEPGAPSGFRLAGPEGQVYRMIHDRKPAAPLADKEKPIQLTHAPLATRDADTSTRFAVDILGFKLSDRTKMMNFVRCDDTHHAIAYVRSDVSSLHHLAFEMQNLEAVMKGVGRLKDLGIEPVWGPGRHGPGNNVFAYYVAPFGAVIEYTSEVQRIDDSYKVGGPEDWKWPPGRIDHWGLSKRDEHKLHPAERLFGFKALS